MNHHPADTKDTCTASGSSRSSRRLDADTTATTTNRASSSNSMLPRRVRRSLPVTTSEVASCMSRKRKMSAPGEEPSSSRPASIVSHRGNEDEAATIPTLPVTAATTVPSTIGNVTGDAVTEVIAPIATTGRPHTAPAGPTEPAKMEESEEMDAQNQMVPCDKKVGMSGGLGGRSKTLKGRVGRNDALVVPSKPTKKITKRSRILTIADDDGIMVVGGRGGRGQSAYMYACNSGAHDSSTNALASSYYLYHGHRHTNDARSSSSLDSFHDCLSTSYKEKKEDDNGRANKNIPDINSSPSCCKSARCPHRRDHNSAQSLTISFLNAYGKDFCAKLRRIDDEQGERPDLSLILSDKSLQRYLTEGDRVHAIEWMSEVSATLDLQDSTFHASVAFLDRLLATRCGMKDEEFHEFALACVFVAAKMNETTWEVHNAPQDFINASLHNMHTQDLIDLESNVCHLLDYRLRTITPLCFLDRFLHASNPTAHYSDAVLRDERLEASGWLLANPHSSKPRGTLESLALYFLELATHSAELSMQKPDMLAASALYLARATFGLSVGIDENAPPSSPPDSLFWDATMEHFTDYTAEELEDIVRTMNELHCDTNHSAETTYVYEKFSTERYRFVSFIPPILKGDLGFL